MKTCNQLSFSETMFCAGYYCLVLPAFLHWFWYNIDFKRSIIDGYPSVAYLVGDFAIGNPERHVRKASHHGSKEQ